MRKGAKCDGALSATGHYVQRDTNQSATGHQAVKPTVVSVQHAERGVRK